MCSQGNVVMHLESFLSGEKLVLQIVTFLEVVVLRSPWLQEANSHLSCDMLRYFLSIFKKQMRHYRRSTNKLSISK